MTKLTPARKALLQKLVDNGGKLRTTGGWFCTRSDKATGTWLEKNGLCQWYRTYYSLTLQITDAGRAALKEAGK